jgi:hypothetical protein
MVRIKGCWGKVWSATISLRSLRPPSNIRQVEKPNFFFFPLNKISEMEDIKTAHDVMGNITLENQIMETENESAQKKCKDTIQKINQIFDKERSVLEGLSCWNNFEPGISRPKER